MSASLTLPLENRAQAISLDGVYAMYKVALKSRLLENKLSSLYKAGKILGGVYVGNGQELISGALGSCLRKGTDYYAPLIRDQAGRLAFGETLLDATRTCLGSVKGPMRGRDGNVHRGRPKEGLFAMISHLGTTASVVSGALMSERLKGTLKGKVGATCIGDGGTSTGAFHEGINLAAVENLPLVVVIANNQYAYSTPNSGQYACKNLIDRAIGYGVEGYSVDGTDIVVCLDVVATAVDRARDGAGPQLIEASFLRLSGHGEHDDAFYVDEAIKQSKLGSDGLVNAKNFLMENGMLNEKSYQDLHDSLQAEIQEAVAQTQQEPDPDPFKDDWRALSSNLV